MKRYASKFIVHSESTKQDKYWANYADENVLLLTNPGVRPYTDMTEAAIQYVSTAAPSLTEYRTPLTDFLLGSGRETTVENEYIHWKLAATGEVKAITLENLNQGVAAPGIGHSVFPIKLDVEWYVRGDRLAPDIAKEIQVIVDSDPIPDGAGFIYNVRLSDRDDNTFFPQSLLAPGINWIHMGSFYGEASMDAGSIDFEGTSYIEFQSDLSSVAFSVEVTDKAHQLNLRVQACDEKGYPVKNMPDKIISYIEAEFLAKVRWQKELSLYYGRSAGKHLTDVSSGYHRRIGPGLLEFLEDGNIIPYPVEGGSVDYFVNFLNRIWIDRVPYNKRNIKIYTGQGGLTLWDRWIQDKYANSSTVIHHVDATKGAKAFDSTNFTGFQFPVLQATKYNIQPFGSITVEHWPILDNLKLNPVLHPDSGLPLSSYEFIVLDYGLGTGPTSNIELLRKKDSEFFDYITGMWTPIGPSHRSKSSGSQFRPASKKRSYELVYGDTYGIRVKDVTLTAWFKPAITVY